MLIKKTIPYEVDGVSMEGYFVFDDANHQKQKTVLVAHDWSGKNDFVCEKADALAKLGFAAFAVDMYGNGITGDTKEEKTALITPLMQDRLKLQKRILKALETAKSLNEVDPNLIAAIGFCFGGLVVLDLARASADIKGVVSFHGLLNAPENLPQETIKAKVLALHGFDDPMVTPEQVIRFGEEMTHRKVDWQLHIYGNTMHAFTNPKANDKNFGTVYDKCSDERSWIAMKDFFAEIFQ